jgi:hypothetical protein
MHSFARFLFFFGPLAGGSGDALMFGLLPILTKCVVSLIAESLLGLATASASIALHMKQMNGDTAS